MSDTKEITLESLAAEFALLKQQNADLVGQLEEKNAALAAAVQANTELGKKVAAAVEGSIAVDAKSELPKLPADPTFTVGKKKYRIDAPAVNIPGLGYRKAEEVLLDPKAQKALIDAKSGIIKEVA